MAQDFQCRNSTGVIPQAGCNFSQTYIPGKEFKQVPDRNFNASYGSGGNVVGVYGKTDVEVAGVK